MDDHATRSAKISGVRRSHCDEQNARIESSSAVPLLLSTKDACALLGGISPRSLRRAEIRGLIRSNQVFRIKLWPREELERFAREFSQ